jgi:hypothetical protein
MPPFAWADAAARSRRPHRRVQAPDAARRAEAARRAVRAAGRGRAGSRCPAASHRRRPITIDDFAKVDLRIAKIVAAEHVEGSDKVLPLGLPDLPFHLRLDALSAFFLLLLGSLGRHLGVRRRLLPQGRGHAAGLLCLCTTCSSPAWRWCCWPTTPTLHGDVGD